MRSLEEVFKSSDEVKGVLQSLADCRRVNEIYFHEITNDLGLPLDSSRDSVFLIKHINSWIFVIQKPSVWILIFLDLNATRVAAMEVFEERSGEMVFLNVKGGSPTDASTTVTLRLTKDEWDEVFKLDIEPPRLHQISIPVNTHLFNGLKIYHFQPYLN